jgi:Uma2 family endonuclease
MRFFVPDINEVRDEHVVFSDTNWDFYQAVLKQFDEMPTRINFDGETLEIMTLSIEHEAIKELIGLMIHEIVMRFDVPTAARGSTTLLSPVKKKGLEAHQCFWIQNEATIRSLKRLDLTIHPPPDLVVEVDVTHAVVDREAVYAALCVPEMWHYNAKTLLTGWERTGESWNRIERSKSFPMIRVTDLNPFLQRLATDGQTVVLKSFREWLSTLA